MQSIATSIRRLLASRRFFWATIIFFVFQALWFVFSAVYPMAFDEAHHFNLIYVYSQQWLPFLTEHPEGYNLNIVTRSPDYLFNYLLSFPYRIFALFTDSQAAQVVFLRLINVGIFSYGLVLYHRLFRKIGVSAALTNVSILLFTLIPIVPLLAAHINYDNALFLLLAWLFLACSRAITTLRTKTVPVQDIMVIAVLGLFASIVKYAALPILTGSVLFLVAYGVWTFRKTATATITKSIKRQWRHMRRIVRYTLLVLLVVGSVLFFERFGLNMIHYGTLTPKCDQVLTHEQCLEFGPYERNFKYRQQVRPDFEPSASAHLSRWTSGMWYRLFFMVNGDVVVDRYANYPPLPIPALTSTVIFSAGLIAASTRPRRLLSGHPFRGLLMLSSALYVFVLWFQNYQGYVEAGRTSALNGRYLLMILLPVISLIAIALSNTLGSRPRLKVVLACAAILLFLQGGGVTSFIVRSSPTWYWPDPRVETVNTQAQRLLSPLIYGSDEEHLLFVPH